MQEQLSKAMRDLLGELKADGIMIGNNERSALVALDRYLTTRANEFVEMAAQKILADQIIR
jgi:hypothetical protein